MIIVTKTIPIIDKYQSFLLGAVPGEVTNFMAVVALHVVFPLPLSSVGASAGDVALLVAVPALNIAFALALGAVAGDVALLSAVVALNALV